MQKMSAIVFCLSVCIAQAQTKEIDSLKRALDTAAENIGRVNLLESLSYAYLSSSSDSALKYATHGLEIAKKIGSAHGEAICINALGSVYFHYGDYPRALAYYLDYLKRKEALPESGNLAIAYYNIAGVYTEEQDYRQALLYLFKAKQQDEKAKDSAALLYDDYSLASAYLRMQQHDSALLFLDQSFKLAKSLHDENMMGALLNTYGEIYFSLKDAAKAGTYYRQSLPFVQATDDKEVITSDYFGLAKLFEQKWALDSAAIYGRRALVTAKEGQFFKQVLEISNFLTGVFSAQKKYDSAFYYQGLSMATKDSLFNIEQLRKVQNLKFDEQQRQQALETARLKERNRVQFFAGIFVLATFLSIALLLWRNNRQTRKANTRLQEQKETIETTLNQLRTTQAQLIQKEKMASLGELTAGIAHEIQNPLNFVNNFSDINAELVSEIDTDLRAGNVNKALSVLQELKENEQKIHHHGMRADAIVKAMLDHSRPAGAGQQPVDLNNMVNEYLRLSYQGMCAKNKEFKASLQTSFDESVGKVPLVAQDIGRVLLNLFNNAFYAVDEKKKRSSDAFEPTITVITKKMDGKVEVCVKDNGIGIPEKMVEKIFQPFFTTKPTGEGTGLGLSLSYDIITKGHGGNVHVKSKEGEGTEFLIELPVPRQ